MMFHTDSPITGLADNPDKLNRTEFAKRIGKALLLKSHSEPLVVSLEGPWGYGKSSVINLIAKYYQTLNTNSSPILVNFNPWMVGCTEHLVQEFLVQFASAIGVTNKGKEFREAAKQLLAYSKIFDVLKWIPGAEPWAGIVGKVVKGVGNAADKIGELKSLDVNHQRDTVINALIKIGKPIVVFIDDMDRLPPADIYQMIRAVKAIANFPQTSFLLTFERSYIENALKQYGIQDASSYLDKIVQVRLHLPLISEKDMHTLSTAELESLAQVDLTSFFEGDQSRLIEVYQLSVKPLLRTPRDVKRIFNRLRFVESSLRQNVCFTDLFALEVLAIKAPYVYEHIRSASYAYHGQEPDYKFSLSKTEEIIKKYETERNNILVTIQEDERTYVRELTCKLFPLIDTGFHGESTDPDFLYARGRIASPDRLRFALTFGLPSGEIPSEQISSFISHIKTRDGTIANLSTDDKIERFIELLLRTIRHSHPSDPKHFVLSIAKLSALPAAVSLQDKPKGIFGVRPFRQLWWIVQTVLEQMPAEDKVTTLLLLAKHQDFLSLAAYAISFCINQQKDRADKEYISEDARWLNEMQLTKLKNNWLKSAFNASKQGILLDTGDKTCVLFTLMKLNPGKIKEIIKPILKQDKNLDKLAIAIGRTGQDSIKGEYSEIKTETLDALGGVDNIRKRVKKRLQSPVDDLTLNAIYNSITTGQGYYLIDNTKMRQ